MIPFRTLSGLAVGLLKVRTQLIAPRLRRETSDWIEQALASGRDDENSAKRPARGEKIEPKSMKTRQ